MNQNQSKLKKVLQKIKAWINRNPSKISLLASLIVIIRIIKPENFFLSPQSIGENFKQDFIFGLFLPDIPSLIFSIIAVVFGWRAIHHCAPGIKKKYKSLIIGIICLLLTVTDAGNVISTIISTFSTSIRVTANVVANGPEEGASFMDGVMEGAMNGQTRTAQEGEYTLDAHVERTQDEAAGTKLRVVGTITNNTADDWTEIDLKFILTDQNGNPKTIEAYGDTPQKVAANISTLNAGETKEFVSSWYPGMLESDFAGLTDFQISDFTYFVPASEENE